MIAEAHEIREKQSAHRAHLINNVAIKAQNQPDDSVAIRHQLALARVDTRSSANVTRKSVPLKSLTAFSGSFVGRGRL